MLPCPDCQAATREIDSSEEDGLGIRAVGAKVDNVTKGDVHGRQHPTGWRAYLHVPGDKRQPISVDRRNRATGRIVRDALAVHEECHV